MAIKREVVEKLAVLITGGLGLVAALAWNSAIQSWFDRQGWLKIGGPWVYALIITLLAVIVTIWIGRVAEHIKKRDEAKEETKNKK